jgi:hypothetical protein
MSVKKSAALGTTLRLPQYRVLKALQPKGGKFPALNRVALAERAGFRGSSGTINRALHGIKKGSSSGDPFKGLLDLGYVRPDTHDLDGVSETVYRATASGVKAAARFAKQRDAAGRKINGVRSAKSATNARYAKGGKGKSKAVKKTVKKSAPKKAAVKPAKATPKAAPKTKTAKPAARKAVKRSPVKKAQPGPATPVKAENPPPVALPIAQPAAS